MSVPTLCPPLLPGSHPRGGCGQEGSHRGDFMTLSFAHSLRAAAYAAPEPRPSGTAQPGTRCGAAAHGHCRYRAGTGGLWGLAMGMELNPVPGSDAGHGRVALRWAGEGGFVHTPGEMAACLSFSFLLPRTGSPPPQRCSRFGWGEDTKGNVWGRACEGQGEGHTGGDSAASTPR